MLHCRLNLKNIGLDGVCVLTRLSPELFELGEDVLLLLIVIVLSFIDFFKQIIV